MKGILAVALNKNVTNFKDFIQKNNQKEMFPILRLKYTNKTFNFLTNSQIRFRSFK